MLTKFISYLCFCTGQRTTDNWPISPSLAGQRSYGDCASKNINGVSIPFISGSTFVQKESQKDRIPVKSQSPSLAGQRSYLTVYSNQKIKLSQSPSLAGQRSYLKHLHITMEKGSQSPSLAGQRSYRNSSSRRKSSSVSIPFISGSTFVQKFFKQKKIFKCLNPLH